MQNFSGQLSLFTDNETILATALEAVCLFREREEVEFIFIISQQQQQQKLGDFLEDYVMVVTTPLDEATELVTQEQKESEEVEVVAACQSRYAEDICALDIWKVIIKEFIGIDCYGAFDWKDRWSLSRVCRSFRALFKKSRLDITQATVPPPDELVDVIFRGFQGIASYLYQSIQQMHGFGQFGSIAMRLVS